MTQNELNRAVAKKTGETVGVISSLGFIPLTEEPNEREPQFVDWHEAAASRHVSLMRRRRHTTVMA